jgi:hypothetical protein
MAPHAEKNPPRSSFAGRIDITPEVARGSSAARRRQTPTIDDERIPDDGWLPEF